VCESPRLGSEGREPQPVYAIVLSIVTKSLPEVTPQLSLSFRESPGLPAFIIPAHGRAAPEDLNGEGKAS
jgi:hypothetical protein